MTPEKALLVDSGTAAKWIFQKDAAARPPVIRHEDIPEDVKVYIGFPMVADLYFEARRLRDRRIEREGAHSGERFYAKAMYALHVWLNEHLFVLHTIDANLSRRWLDIVNGDPVHEGANREHAWVVVMAQYLRDNRRIVQIASEDSSVYRAYAEAGHLDDVGVHGTD